MTPFLFVLWVAQVLGSYAMIFLVQIPLRKRPLWIIRTVLFLVKAFLLMLLAYMTMSISAKFVWNSGYLFVGLYVAMFGDLLTDIVTLPLVIKRKSKGCILIQAIVSLVMTLAVMIYGTINMETIKPKYHTYESSKITESHRFVYLSDLHYGSAQSEKVVVNAINRIVSENPDFILLGGDITDEHTTKAEMEHIYQLLGSTGIPTFYTYGNHDRQPEGDFVGGPFYTPAELEEAIKSNGITILKDSWVQISSDLVVLGREDFSDQSRLPVAELPAWPKESFVVLLDHSPYQTEDIVATGAELQLSGHTHAGQLFPLQLIYNLTGHDAYGTYHHGDTELYVSPGITGWYFPLRTEAHCNYEVVDLVPSK